MARTPSGLRVRLRRGVHPARCRATRRSGHVIHTEPELSRLLAVSRTREGVEPASAALRSAWDFRRMELRTRSHLLDAPAAPVSLVGHITMGELRDTRHGLRGVEILNGFGNRVLWTYVDRRKSVSSPRPLRGTEITPLVWRLRLALESARRSGEVMRSPEAELLWKGLYGEIVDDAAEGIVDAVVARGEAQLLRLSLIYALLDGSATIGPRHLESAWEVWRYCRWSAQHIWVGDGTGDPDLDRIADLLSAGDELSAYSAGQDVPRTSLDPGTPRQGDLDGDRAMEYDAGYRGSPRSDA